MRIMAVSRTRAGLHSQTPPIDRLASVVTKSNDYNVCSVVGIR